MGSNGERFDWLRFEDVFVCVFILEEYVRVTGCSGIVFSVFLLPYDIPNENGLVPAYLHAKIMKQI